VARRSYRLRLSALLRAAVFVFAVGAAGCGESAPDSAPVAPGAPDVSSNRTSANEVGPRELLARVRTRVEQGTGLGDAAWGTDVGHLALLLWPVGPADSGQVAAINHAQLTNIAGDVGRDLARKPEDRAVWAARDAVSLEIYDAWLAAADRNPDAYRAWVEGGGAILVQRLRKERAQLFERR
jgi:hypothetical protein